MRNAKKLISILLVAALLITTVATAAFTVSAAGGTLSSHYQTNPSGKVGKAGSITIDGDLSDWTEDMLVATSAAWDCANHWKGSHENCLIDAYALFASWDSSNLYIGMQYVNTTDTWQNPGDASLMDGGKIGDLHLVLALSVNPSSTGLTGKVTDGKYIWGDQIDYSGTHVDHLFYMSAKPGTGVPGHFTVADAAGNTDYTTHCGSYKTEGIEYKMADGNACSSIWGLNNSDSTDDVFSDSSDWVDYKTYKGSKGVHNTKYDSFYEIKIPFTALGITASQLTSNGIGAMTLCGRGESALDCCPFDSSMIDNVKGDYGNDPSTSHEKDDLDALTVPLASIGKGGVTPTPQPTTAPVTTPQPTTAPVTTPQPTTDPVSDKTVVNATSNICGSGNVTATGSTVTVTYNLQSAMDLVNGQWNLKYDTSKLRFKTAASKLMPNISGSSNIYNDVAYGTFSEIYDPYDFKTSKAFVQAEFEVIGKGTANVALDVQELSVGYFSGSTLKFENAVKNSQKQNLSSISGFSSNNVTGSTSVINGSPSVDTKLTVNATSNFFPASSTTVNQTGTKVTVQYLFQSTHDMLNSEWTLTYDSSKLSYNSSATGSIMPNASGVVASEPSKGRIKGSSSSTLPCEFTTEKPFVKVTFDVLDTGTATVNLNVAILGLVNASGDQGYLVDGGSVKNLKSQSGFSNLSYSTNTKFGDISAKAIKVKTTSNYFPETTRSLTDSSQITVAFKLQSYYELINSEWELSYDPAKLSFNKADLKKLQPNLTGAVALETTTGLIKGNFSNLSCDNFYREKDFVTVTFDIIGTGETTVNMNLKYLGVVNEENKEGFVIEKGQDTNLKSKTGFSKNSTYGVSAVMPNGNKDRIKGDTNFDGTVDISDATYIQKHVAEYVLFNNNQLAVADVTSDGKVDIADATQVQRMAAN
ncbi:dockerin type I domain-containing protein [Ruminococcus sp.]|uniref:dockerin type I domain-containing protein n=1 Tax=Ruminococcus sp. TaxID=41978 RepID=UPI003869ECA9